MHAGLLILLWVLGVGALQYLDPAPLLLAVALCAAAALALARARTLRLLRRVRVLLAAIVVLFAGFTPGEAVFIHWPALSPSREGLSLALTHASALLAVVCCVALLLEHLPADRLISGLYALCRPLAVFGLSAERVAVRMLLVLRYVDAPQARGWREWLSLADDDAEAGVLHLQRERLGRLDVLVLAALAIAVCGYLLW
ncbi:CbiQ family ECF transporter T component [Pseudothauera lacus]|uniref:Cobalt transport protein n=1 Tax=Pseudothauera lacus TaxID=2136175 RepID=A0A2T4II81_9RHOO|nr:CbiQ family ECF transporter T component [Pseudothauera lacus]PTD97436.1 hypothetical protein C8261_05405 [Pseudothauera lacus]